MIISLLANKYACFKVKIVQVDQSNKNCFQPRFPTSYVYSIVYVLVIFDVFIIFQSLFSAVHNDFLSWVS